MEWIIIYSYEIDGSNPETITVLANTYTEALVNFTIKYKNAIALQLFKKEI